MKQLSRITISYDIDDIENIKKLEETFTNNEPIEILGKYYRVNEIKFDGYMYKNELSTYRFELIESRYRG